LPDQVDVELLTSGHPLGAVNGIPNRSRWSSLIAALGRFAINYSEHVDVARVGELLPAPIFDHRNAICIGCYSMRRASTRYGWSPGVLT
jgi:hypothetical protein